MPADRIPWCTAELGEHEEEYVVRALRQGQFGPGATWTARFEQALAETAGVRHAIATNSGTSALHIALLLSGVQPGDEVVVPAWTFVATANAVRYAGAHPVALDVDPLHWQLDPAQLALFLHEHASRHGAHTIDTRTGRRIAAVVPVHLLGHPADLDALRCITDAYRLSLVEDAAQGLGATYHGRPVGSGGLSAISFNFNKLVTAGAGGALLLDDDQQAKYARYLINQARTGSGYQHGHVGYNYRMTGVHAAIGLAQLERLDTLLATKRGIRDRYRRHLAHQPGIRFQQDALGTESNGWLSTILLDPGPFGHDVTHLRERLSLDGIETGPAWTPLHLTGAHAGCAPQPCPVAENLGRNSLHLPCSTTLTPAEHHRVVTAIRQASGHPSEGLTDVQPGA